MFFQTMFFRKLRFTEVTQYSQRLILRIKKCNTFDPKTKFILIKLFWSVLYAEVLHIILLRKKNDTDNGELPS